MTEDGNGTIAINLLLCCLLCTMFTRRVLAFVELKALSYVRDIIATVCTLPRPVLSFSVINVAAFINSSSLQSVGYFINGCRFLLPVNVELIARLESWARLEVLTVDILNLSIWCASFLNKNERVVWVVVRSFICSVSRIKAMLLYIHVKQNNQESNWCNIELPFCCLCAALAEQSIKNNVDDIINIRYKGILLLFLFIDVPDMTSTQESERERIKE